jgi:hypothetical protein
VVCAATKQMDLPSDVRGPGRPVCPHARVARAVTTHAVAGKRERLIGVAVAIGQPNIVVGGQRSPREC